MKGAAQWVRRTRELLMLSFGKRRSPAHCCSENGAEDRVAWTRSRAPGPQHVLQLPGLSLDDAQVEPVAGQRGH